MIVLAGVTVFLAIAVLVATAMSEDGELRRLAWLRRACLVSAATLVGLGVAKLESGFALAGASVALALCVLALWLSARRAPSLRSCLDRLVVGGEAAWRDEFERPLRRYMRDVSRRRAG